MASDQGPTMAMVVHGRAAALAPGSAMVSQCGSPRGSVNSEA